MKTIRIGTEEIKLPGWLPIHAVDPRKGPQFDEYWSMVATGSITLTADQLSEAQKLVREVERLLSTSSS